MHPAWARSLRDQCADAAVPFLFKQWGEWQPVHPSGAAIPGCGTTPQREPAFRFEHDHYFTKVGKKAAGRMLDGVLHDGDDTAAYKRRQTRKRIDYDTNAYHNGAWTSNPPFKRSPRLE